MSGKGYIYSLALKHLHSAYRKTYRKKRVYFLNVPLRPEEGIRCNLVEEGREVSSGQRGLHKRPFGRR